LLLENSLALTLSPLQKRTVLEKSSTTSVVQLTVKWTIVKASKNRVVAKPDVKSVKESNCKIVNVQVSKRENLKNVLAYN